MNIDRNKLKHNFLRRVIIRIDYKGLIDIKDTIKEIQTFLKKNKFTEIQEDFINRVEFELNDPVKIESQRSIPLKDVLRTKTYKFSTKDRSLQLEINSLFMALNVNVKEYKNYETYGPMFIELFNSLKETNPYLKPLRIGLRKINNCILRDYKFIDECFNKELFPFVKTALKDLNYDANQLNSSYVDNLSHKRYMINYVRALTQGDLEENGETKKAYQIAIDTDGYNNDEEWLEQISEECQSLSLAFQEINDTLFELYTNTLTTSFINQLEETDFNNKNIIGVKPNVI